MNNVYHFATENENANKALTLLASAIKVKIDTDPSTVSPTPPGDLAPFWSALASLAIWSGLPRLDRPTHWSLTTGTLARELHESASAGDWRTVRAKTAAWYNPDMRRARLQLASQYRTPAPPPAPVKDLSGI